MKSLHVKPNLSYESFCLKGEGDKCQVFYGQLIPAMDLKLFVDGAEVGNNIGCKEYSLV